MGHALTTEPAFQAWIKTERPLLLLAGQNWLGDSQTELNWSSYAILLIIEGCEQKRAEFLLSGLPGPTPVVVCYLCQPTSFASKHTRPS